MIINLILYSCRLLTGYCTQDVDESVLLMNNNLTKEAPLQTLFQHNNPCITTKKDNKPYNLQHFDTIKLPGSQYIATSIIKYGSYTDNMFALENIAHNFLRLLHLLLLKSHRNEEGHSYAQI